jgi:glyoxylase-like metal-dependent hydrolase (beta-lactamase superfamily II)
MITAKGLRQIDMDEEILSGIGAIPLVGHTLGQIGLVIESQGEKLFHLADLIHSPMQLARPEWSPKYDADIRLSVPTRIRALEKAADENLLTFFYHLPFPALGYIKHGDKSDEAKFIFEPVD